MRANSLATMNEPEVQLTQQQMTEIRRAFRRHGIDLAPDKEAGLFMLVEAIWKNWIALNRCLQSERTTNREMRNEIGRLLRALDGLSLSTELALSKCAGSNKEWDIGAAIVGHACAAALRPSTTKVLQSFSSRRGRPHSEADFILVKWLTGIYSMATGRPPRDSRDDQIGPFHDFVVTVYAIINPSAVRLSMRRLIRSALGLRVSHKSGKRSRVSRHTTRAKMS